MTTLSIPYTLKMHQQPLLVIAISMFITLSLPFKSVLELEKFLSCKYILREFHIGIYHIFNVDTLGWHYISLVVLHLLSMFSSCMELLLLLEIGQVAYWHVKNDILLCHQVLRFSPWKTKLNYWFPITSESFIHSLVLQLLHHLILKL